MYSFRDDDGVAMLQLKKRKKRTDRWGCLLGQLEREEAKNPVGGSQQMFPDIGTSTGVLCRRFNGMFKQDLILVRIQQSDPPLPKLG